MKLKNILGLALVAGMLSLISFPAQGQIATNTIYTLTNLPTKLTAGSTSNLVSQPLTIRKDQGMSVLATMTCTNETDSGTVTLGFQVSLDGTNYSTASGLNLVVALNGTNMVRAWTNFPPDILNNARRVMLRSMVTTATNTVWATNVVCSFSN